MRDKTWTTDLPKPTTPRPSPPKAQVAVRETMALCQHEDCERDGIVEWNGCVFCDEHVRERLRTTASARSLFEALKRGGYITNPALADEVNLWLASTSDSGVNTKR